MYQGRHSTSGSPRFDRPAASRRAGGRKKPLTLFVALVLLLTLAVGGSLAWLVSNDIVVTNTMVPGEVPIEIVEQIDGTTKTSITIKNNGNIDAYIRVAVVANKVDKDGNVTVGEKPNFAVSTAWTEIDNYYYYNGIVEPKAATAPLFTGDVNFTNAEVNILAESIQVLGGVKSDGSASVDAWGVVYSNGTWTKTA